MPNPSDHLTPDQLKTLLEEVTRPAAHIPLTVVSGTGLCKAEFLHLHQEWIDWPTKDSNTPSHPIIRIPEEEKCRRQKIDQGHTIDTELVTRNRPCCNCRHGDGSSLGYFKNKRSNKVSNTVPVIDENAVQSLKWWFNRFDTIPWNGKYTALNSDTKRLLNRRINHTGLRKTFIARAAKMELSLDLIAKSTGTTVKSLTYSDSPYLEILREYGEYTDSLPSNNSQTSTSYQNHTFQDYLDVIDKKPTSTKQLAEKLSVTNSVASRMMYKCKDDGFVEIVGETEDRSTIWKNIVPPDTELQCRYNGCSESFDSRIGRSSHERSHDQ